MNDDLGHRLSEPPTKLIPAPPPGLAVQTIFWKVTGVSALGVSIWLLSRELRTLSFMDLEESLAALPVTAWLACGGFAIVAYLFLGCYDWLALTYLRKKMDPIFAATCGAVTYAFSHTIGASVFSGAVIRYRAYSLKGLSGGEVARLVAFCSFTFVLGAMAVTGAALVADPLVLDRFTDAFPLNATRIAGSLLTGIVIFYITLSMLPLRRLKIGKLDIAYPTPAIALLQVTVAAAEIIFAAMIVYFALPVEGNPGIVTVTGIFMLSFLAALVSHSPGGLGVFELVFITGMPDMNRSDVLAALLIFRLFYFILPFVFSLAIIARFEFGRRL
ncbi:lysylphosphatidylglycerol synthase domain-containing protein [Rhizobium binae]|uniref:lysylphosphatidylglycerol synthase domain-containing protein n=1 Tax=Rhizobium binae TaxID=1138190 RepID=UPI003DA92D52